MFNWLFTEHMKTALKLLLVAIAGAVVQWATSVIDRIPVMP